MAAKPIMSRCGLELHRLKPSHITPFVDDMSPESKRELRVAYGLDPLAATLECLKKDMTFTVMRDGHPLAITGLDQGFMWALFGNGLRKNWFRFAKASPYLIDFYHDVEPHIMCDIWSRSTKIAQWLTYLDFSPIQVMESDDGNTFIRFVRCDNPEACGLSQASRPVMH